MNQNQRHLWLVPHCREKMDQVGYEMEPVPVKADCEGSFAKFVQTVHEFEAICHLVVAR